MSTVRIFLDGQEADFAADLFPFRIERTGDIFTQILSSESAKIDNPAKRIVLRGNKRNHAIFQNAHLPHAEAVRGSSALPLTAYVQGTQIMQGDGILRSINGEGERTDYSLGARGGADAFFSRLTGLQLPDLDLGSAVWNLPTIEGSWTEPIQTVQAVWAPVYYGRLDPPHEFDLATIRPHIPFKRIMEAIERATGYTIESTLFETDYFQRHLYAYGNEEAVITSDFAFEARNTVLTDHTSVVWTPVRFDDELSDPTNSFDVVAHNYVAPTTGYYRFSGNTFWESAFASQIPNSSLRIRAGSVTQALPLDSTWSFGPVLLQANDTVAIEGRSIPFNSGATSITPRFMSFTGRLVEPTQEGTTIDYASTLHRRPVRDFLDGVSHMFNLVWRADPLLKRVYVDPRFEYQIGGITYPGMYRAPAFEEVNQLAARVSTRNVLQRIERPFGDYVSIGPKPEESYLYETAALNGSGPVPFLSARYDFRSPIGQEGSLDQNPYFEGALTKGGILSRGMAHIAPEQEFGEDERVPNYASEPKWLYYYGVESGMNWSWNGSVITNRPVAVQIPEGFRSYPEVGSYRDWTDPITNEVRPGYVRRFYLKWLACLDPGRMIKVSVLWRNHELARPLFQKIHAFSAGTDSTQQWWLLSAIKGIDPTSEDLPESTFFLYREVRQEHVARLVSNLQNPATNG